jgi:hypothetical protein
MRAGPRIGFDVLEVVVEAGQRSGEALCLLRLAFAVASPMEYAGD